MACLDIQKEAHPIANCIPIADNGERVVAFSTSSNCDLSVNCLLKVVRIGQTASLSARVKYVFSEAVPATAADALNYADEINQKLQYSQVFVVKDIDGSGQHYLRMDSVLHTHYKRQDISHFLDRITQDIGILVSYFTFFNT